MGYFGMGAMSTPAQGADQIKAYNDKLALVTQLTPEQYAKYQASNSPPTADGVRAFAQANNIQLTNTNTNTNTNSATGGAGGSSTVNIGSGNSGSLALPSTQTMLMIAGGFAALAAVLYVFTGGRHANPLKYASRVARRVLR